MKRMVLAIALAASFTAGAWLGDRAGYERGHRDGRSYGMDEAIYMATGKDVEFFGCWPPQRAILIGGSLAGGNGRIYSLKNLRKTLAKDLADVAKETTP